MSAELNNTTISKNEIVPETYTQSLEVITKLKEEINEKLTELIEEEKSKQNATNQQGDS